MTGAPEIVTLGEPLIEFVRSDDPGIGAHYLPGFGGDSSNVAVAAARQGGKAGCLTALGHDAFGRRFLSLWAGEGIDTTHVRQKAGPTGLNIIEPDPSGRDFTYYRAGSSASLYGPEDLPAGYIEDARVLHLSGITQAVSPTMRAASIAAMVRARAAGTLISYDTNLRLALWSLDQARAVIGAALAMTDIALPGEDEAEQLWGLSDADAILDHVLALGPRIVALKCGARGAVIATPERRERIPPVPCTPLDSTGAGDAFAGSFLAEHLATGDPFRAGRHAARVAAVTVTGYGAVIPIPRREELDSLEPVADGP